MSRIVLPPQPLVDGATALRPWRDSDLPALVVACQDPEIPRWTRVPSPYGETDARAYLFGRHQGPETGTAAPFAVVDATDTSRLLGSIALMRFDWEHGRAEVGYWMAAEARGAGHVTRAVRLICTWGFAALAVERIELYAATGNPASQRVAERAGFTREGVMRSFWVGRDGRHDMVVFSRLKSEGG